MTAQEAIRYIESASWSRSKTGLERARQLMSKLGDPQKKLKFVHVAGTNGKGSTCAMLASVLQCSGYKTGLFTSPHLLRINERMKINGREIDDEHLTALTEALVPAVKKMDEQPSRFELLTALAMLWFYEANCDIVVLEVGLGGRYDCTNVIDSPECSVICNIGLEHTEYLGNTLAQIATEKAGIIKTGCPVVCYRSSAEAMDVFLKAASELSASITPVDFSSLNCVSRSLEGQIFSFKEFESLNIPLLGRHQLKNAAVVIETLEILKKHSFNIGEDSLRKGLAVVQWQARFEVLSLTPPVIIDGAHNPQCAEALSETLNEFFPGKQSVFIFGVLSDKDYHNLIDYLIPCADSFICITPPSPLALSGEELADTLRLMGENAESFDDLALAAETALSKGRPVVVCGSLYIAGQMRELLMSMLNK